MSAGNPIPPSVSPEAAKLLERAYGLSSAEESLALYHDWASTSDDTMLTGLGYVSPARLHEADLTRRLPMDGETCDVVACSGTFTHGHIGADCLGELLRVLKRGGILACTVHGDVWKELGFEQAFAAFEAGGRVERLVLEPGAYYENAREPDGWYGAWRKAAA